MNLIKTAFCLILCAFLLGGCSFVVEGINDAVDAVTPVTLTGALKTETVTPSDGIPATKLDFENITFSNVGGKVKIKVIPSDETRVEATYPSDMENYGFAITIREGEIDISVPKQTHFAGEGFEVTVYANLTEIDISGGIELEVDASASKTMDIEVAGATSLYMYGVAAEELSLDIKGAASMDITGRTNRLELELAGAGAVDAKSLICKVAEVRISGAGSAEISVTDELLADMDGVGALAYYGDPTVKNLSGGLTDIEQVSKEVYGG